MFKDTTLCTFLWNWRWDDLTTVFLKKKLFRLDGHEFGWTPGVGGGQGGLACCSSWGRKELDTTEQLNWTELNYILGPQTDQNLRNDDIDLFWPFWIQASKAWTLATFTPILCWILFCSSFFMTMLTPPKPLHIYACTFSLRLPQYHSSEDCFGKDPQGSPYLLQVVGPSFSCSWAWLYLLLDTYQEVNPIFRQQQHIRTRQTLGMRDRYS